MAELTKNDMRLPEGKTCGDCAHIRYCIGLFSCDKTNTSCDWAPSRFRERAGTTTGSKGGKDEQPS